MPSQEERAASLYAPYRGPLGEGVTTEAAGSDPQLPRVSTNEDDATYNTTLSEFEVWMRLLDKGSPDDEPPPSAPDSERPWWLKDDEEEGGEEGKLAA